MDKGLFQSPDFLQLDPAEQKAVARNYFEETLATSHDYAKLDQDERQTVYNNYLSEVLPSNDTPRKGIVQRVIDKVSAPIKAISNAFSADRADNASKAMSAAQHPDDTDATISGNSSIVMKSMVVPATGGKTVGDIQTHDKSLSDLKARHVKMDEVRKAQREFEDKPIMEQLKEQFLEAPMRGSQNAIVALPVITAELAGYGKAAQEIQKQFSSHDTISKAYPEYAAAESVIFDPLNTIDAPVKAVAQGVKEVSAANKIHAQAGEILKSASEAAGIDLPKPKPANNDEAIAKAMNAEYSNQGEAHGADHAVPEHTAEVPQRTDVSDISVGSIDHGEERQAIPEKTDPGKVHEVQPVHDEAAAPKAEPEHSADENPPADLADEKIKHADETNPGHNAETPESEDALTSEPAPAVTELPKYDDLQNKFAQTFGNDAARHTMKLIDKFAESKGMSAEEWIAKSGIDFEDMTHTNYSQFKKDLAEADGLFQKQPIYPSNDEWIKARDEWHKDSHELTKNEDGTPKVFYHGTTADFDKFKQYEGSYGKASYFTSDSDYASEYAGVLEAWDKSKVPELEAGYEGGNIMPVHLHINKPLTLKEFRDEFNYSVKKAQQYGYDGIIDNANDIYGVFKSNQIKSINNRGTFNATHPNVLLQNEKLVNGMVSMGFKEDGEMRSVIRAFESADVSTLVHETAHVFERTLDDAQRAVYDKAFAKYTEGVSRQEAFAEGFVKWLHEGKAPSEDLADVFSAFRDWLSNLWRVITNTKEEAFVLSDEMREFYRALMGDKESAEKLFKGKRGEMGSAYGELMHAKVLEDRYIDPKTNRIDVDALVKDSDADLPKPIESYKEFVGMFDRSADKYSIDTPIGKLNIDPRYAYQHLTKNSGNMNRFEISGAFVDTYKDPLFVVRQDYKRYSKLPKNKNDKGEYEIVDSHVFYKAYRQEEEYHIAGFSVDENGKLINTTFFRIEKADLGKLKGMIKVPEKDMEYFKHSQEAEALDSERNVPSRSANNESVHQNKNDVNELLQARNPEESAGGFYSVAKRAIEAMSNRMNVRAFRNYLKGKGVKDNEIIHSGIAKALDGKETITKAEMMEAVKEPELSAKVLDKPKYKEYSLGGENYREELTQLSHDGKKYKSGHWDEPNVLYHVRKQDIDIDGKKTLLIDELQSDWMQAKRKGEKVPDAPYEKTWHEKALKDQIDEAVRKGYDRVAWVDGETQTNRFKMSHAVDRVVYNKEVGMVVGYKDGEQVIYRSATDKELASIIGKDPAQKLMDSEVKPGVYEIKGEALDIGGDGMRGFYDKILPDYARKYVKKWGAEVEKKILSDGTEVWSFPITEKMREDVIEHGQPLYAHGMGAIAGVETDEDGNITGFDPLRALIGATAGSALMSKTVRGAIAKIAVRAEKMGDAAARNLVIHTIKAVDKVTAQSITKTVEAIRKSDLADYVIGHKIYGMKDYMKLREEALRAANAGMEFAARMHMQLRELSSEAREAMYEYMSGNKDVVLTPELKTLCDTFVSKIDTMGKRLVDEGVLSKEAYEEWKGQYLHRRYASKMKRTSDWMSGKGEYAVDKIRMRGKTWNGSEEEYQDLRKSGMIGKVSEGKVEAEAKGDGTYAFRRDWTREERTAMGEIRDAAYSVPETIGHLTQLIEFSNMLRSVPAKYMLEQAHRSDVIMKNLGYEKLNGSRYGALNGKWVSKSIANDLKRVSNDVSGDESVVRIWKDYVSAMKMSHTIYNPAGHVNNIGSNVVLQAAGGLNPVKTITYATDGARAARKFGIWKELDAKSAAGLNDNEVQILSKLENDPDVSLWRELNDKHMFGRSHLNEMLRTYMSPHADTKAGSAMHKVSETAKAMYQGEDDVMRFAAVKQLMDDGLWVEDNGGIALKKMDIDEAIAHVNDNLTPDYTKPMSALALKLRDTGVVPFMSWTYYSTPILLKQLRDHPVRVMGVIGSWYAMDRLFGVDPFDDERTPKGWADQRMAVGHKGNKVTGLRVSSMIPHIQLATPENTFIEPLTSGIPQTILGEATNYNFYFRKPITQKEGAEGTYQRMKDAVQNTLPTPDVLDKAYNIAESHLLDKETRRHDRVFEPRTPAQEAASFLVNLQTYDESNQRASYRKDRVSERKRQSKWGKKVDKALHKIERVFE